MLIGIDLGGTFIKSGIADSSGNLIYTKKVPTPASRIFEEVVEAIAMLIDDLCEDANMVKSQIKGVGVACPGHIDRETGVVHSSSNLQWWGMPLRQSLSKQCGLSVEIINDAEAALLGEMAFGSGKGFESVVMLTLGTGIGSAVYKYGRLLERTELGHTVIQSGGEQCACGRKGCFEAYASATALVRDTKRAVATQETAMRKEQEITGKTVFDYRNTDKVAKQVADKYLKMLACGISNAVSVFHPQRVVLGGGVCAQGQWLVEYLTKLVHEDKHIETEIVIAKNQNSAGIIGAIALWR